MLKFEKYFSEAVALQLQGMSESLGTPAKPCSLGHTLRASDPISGGGGLRLHFQQVPR